MNVNVYVFDKQNNREPLVFSSHTVVGSSSVYRVVPEARCAHIQTSFAKRRLLLKSDKFSARQA